MTKNYRIVAIPGEGIGLEVVEAALIVLQEVAKQHNFVVQVDAGVIGRVAFEKYGSYFPEKTAELCAGSDGCLLYTSPSPRDLSTSRMPSSA